MTTFLLVRHGENEYVKKGLLAGRLPGVHLNARGKEQAQSLAAKLAGAPVKAIYSSPLERTLETAQPIADILTLPVIVRPGLIEVDVGSWTGQKLRGLRRQKLWKTVQAAPSRMRFPAGEAFAAAQLRIAEELEGIRVEHEPRDLVVCVTHSDVIKLAVAYFVGLPLDFFQRLHVSPGSITTLYLAESGAELFCLNYETSLSLPKG